MRTTIIFVACVISHVVAVDRSKDQRYCLTELCGYGNTACMNNGSLVYCNIQGPRVLNMTRFQEQLAHLFNDLRNDVAGGKYRSLPQAAQMAKMSWSDELAWFAHLDVVLCRKSTDHCHSSPYFYYIGVLTEEVLQRYSSDAASVFAVISGVISYWKRGVASIERKHILHLPKAFEKASNFRAALMINERNTHFGCAMLYFTNYEHFIFSCAFATANIIGRPIYHWGLKPGIKCHKLDRKYKNLCASGEKYGNHKKHGSAEIITEE